MAFWKKTTLSWQLTLCNERDNDEFEGVVFVSGEKS